MRAIEAEDTLKMIQEALASAGDEGAAAPKKKKVVKGKKIATKKTVDSVARFFNNHSENPHLQQIENAYLKYLSAQHAQESHLKAVKKLHILRALRTIQRYWKKKYVQIQERSAVKIQQYARKFLGKMSSYKTKLRGIRVRLLIIKLKKALLQFMKRRRFARSKVRPDVMDLAKANLPKVLKI